MSLKDKMSHSTDLRQLIIEYLKYEERVSSKEIHDAVKQFAAYATVKRTLQSLISEGYIQIIGNGKSTKYCLSPSYSIIAPINLETYFLKEIDERQIRSDFNLILIDEVLNSTQLFSEGELERLNNLQSVFKQNTSNLTEDEFNREFERLAIDLSWKSSQIEGNTYSLLETELLLREKQTAAGKTKDEATMLLNHKEALDFIAEQLKANPKMKLEIQGFSDAEEDKVGVEKPQYAEMSRKRVDAITVYLTDKGIDATRLIGVDKGSETPNDEISDSDDDDLKMAKNRRVFFKAI
jgi:Fic family protein